MKMWIGYGLIALAVAGLLVGGIQQNSTIVGAAAPAAGSGTKSSPVAEGSGSKETVPLRLMTKEGTLGKTVSAPKYLSLIHI